MLLTKFKKKFIGDKAFYKMLLVIALPIMLQNGITNFVSLLDNIMVGQVGTEQMSGVAIANQLIFVFNLCIFGGVAGPGIFTSQYHGYGSIDGVKKTFRFKLIIATVITAVFLAAFLLFDEPLISLYLHDTGSGGDIVKTLGYSRGYMRIMLIGIVPFAFSQCYASTLRETEHAVLPMIAGIVAVLVNLTFNWLLIFGNLGFPCLGVNGAAIATVMSRFVELAIVVIWTHTHTESVPYAKGLFKDFSIGRELAKKVTIKGLPLLFNETLWSLGMTTILQCYSMRGLEAVAAANISSTMSNLFNAVLLAMGNTISIIIGKLLGTGKMDEAKDTDTKLIATSFFACIFLGIIVFLLAPLFPSLYNTTDSVKSIAATFLRITAIVMPLMAVNHGCYFTLRSGGKTFITFLFDSAFIWVICLPPAFILSHYTGVGLITIYAVVQATELIKAIIGFILVKKGLWINNIVSDLS